MMSIAVRADQQGGIPFGHQLVTSDVALEGTHHLFSSLRLDDQV